MESDEQGDSAYNAMRFRASSRWLGLAATGLVAGALLGCSSSTDGAGAAGAGGDSVGSSGASAMAGAGSPDGSSGSAQGGASAGGASAAGGASSGDSDPDSNPCDIVIYDGETGSHPSGTDSLVYIGFPMPANIVQDTHRDPKYGTTALQNILDPSGSCCGTMYYSWTNYDKGPGQPVDGTKAINFEFWIKVESGTYWNLQIEMGDNKGKNSFTGQDVHIADYTDARLLDSTWRQAKVPLPVFNTNGIDLSHLSSYIIEGDRAVTFDLDEVKFTRDTCQ